MPLNKSTLSGSISVLGDIELTGSLLGTASWALNAVNAQTSISASYLSGSYAILKDLKITNTASIEYLNVVIQSSSIIYSSGSNIFGDSPSDTQTLHGQVDIENDSHIFGKLEVDGGITGSLLGSASYAENSGFAQEAAAAAYADLAETSVSSSHALVADVAVYVETAQTASYFLTSSVSSASIADVAIYVETAQTASYFLTSSVTSASFSATASYVENAQSASYFLTSSVTSASWAATASYAANVADVVFTKEWHVSSGSGNDTTGNGSLSKPWKTLTKAFASVGSTGEQIVVHPGVYLDSPTLTAQNVTIAAANANAGGICYMNGVVTIAAGGSSTRIVGILFNNLIHSGSAGLYLDKCQVKANYTKIGSGYSEIINTDLQASGSVVFKGGTTVIQGDKQALVQASGSGTAVYIKDSIQSVAPSAVAGGTLVLADSQVYPLASGSAAITSAAGTVVYLYNTQITTATGLPERINIGGFLGYDDVQFNKSLSTLGTSLGIKAHFQNADINGLTATGSLFGTASWAQNFLTSSVTSASLAQTASFFNGNSISVASLNVTSTASIAYLDVKYQSSSIIYSSGSNIFGDNINDTQTLNGFVLVSGSMYISGGLEVAGGLVGNISNATSASYALNASTASYVENAQSASYVQTAQTASYFFTSSVTSASIAENANNAISSSYSVNALSASYVILNSVASDLNFTNDTDAAAAGVPMGGLYRNGNFVQIRIS